MKLFSKIINLNKAGELSHKSNIGALSKPLKDTFIEAGIPVSWVRKEKRKSIWDKLPKLYEDGYQIELSYLIATCGEDVLDAVLHTMKEVRIENNNGVWDIIPDAEKNRVNIYGGKFDDIDWYVYF